MVELIQYFNTQTFFQAYNMANQNALLGNLAVFGAKYLILIIFLIVATSGLFGNTSDRKALILVILAVPFAAVSLTLIHLFINEPRPFVAFPISPLIAHPNNPSFPSIHATWSAVAAFGLIFYKHKFAPLLFVLMLWVGLSRVFVGVHYPSDVLGGFVVGLLSIFLAWQTKNFIQKNLLN